MEFEENKYEFYIFVRLKKKQISDMTLGTNLSMRIGSSGVQAHFLRRFYSA